MEDNRISQSSPLGPEVELGFGVVIEEGVEVGPRCILGHGVILHSGVRLGAGCRIGDYSVLGATPASSTREKSSEPARTELGEGVRTGVGVVIHRGATIERRVVLEDRSLVGAQTLIQEDTSVGAGSMISFQARIGARVRIERMVLIGGGSEVGELSVLAPLVVTSNDDGLGRRGPSGTSSTGPCGVVIEKGARLGIGAEAFVAAGAVVARDVPAKMMVRGVPAKMWKPVPSPELLEKQRQDMSTPPVRRI